MYMYMYTGMQLTIVEESICTVCVRKNVVKLVYTHRCLLCIYAQDVILAYVHVHVALNYIQYNAWLQYLLYMYSVNLL